MAEVTQIEEDRINTKVKWNQFQDMKPQGIKTLTLTQIEMKLRDQLPTNINDLAKETYSN